MKEVLSIIVSCIQYYLYKTNISYFVFIIRVFFIADDVFHIMRCKRNDSEVKRCEVK